MTATESKKSETLRRVQKMMAIANDAAASEGERDNALRMAHSALAKYNLSMAEATNFGAEQDDPRGAGRMIIQEHPWMRGVANAVAELFFCEFFYQGSKTYKATYVFIGKESNITTAREMSRYVINSINREARRAARERGESVTGLFWRSFCKGAARRVAERCREIRATAERASTEPAEATMSSGTAIVLASVYASELAANLAKLAEMGTKINVVKSREHGATASGYYAGVAFGDRIGLQNQLGHAGKRPTNNKLLGRG